MWRSEDSKTCTTGSELLQLAVPQMYKSGSLRTPPGEEEVAKDAHGCDEPSQKIKNNFMQLKNSPFLLLKCLYSTDSEE